MEVAVESVVSVKSVAPVPAVAPAGAEKQSPVSVEILDGFGKLEFRETIQPTDPDFPRLIELYEMAKRQVETAASHAR